MRGRHEKFVLRPKPNSKFYNSDVFSRLGSLKMLKMIRFYIVYLFYIAYLKLYYLIQGDSGSALVCQSPGSCAFQIAGLVSFGPKFCAQVDKPGVYTKVAPFREWIDEEVAKIIKP